MLRLYSYFRSSAAYRVRIALNLKQLEHEIVAVNLVRGEQRGEAYRALNPQALVPALQLPDGRLLTQSGAILEWLEESFPAPALLPADAFERARVRAFCQAIACDIHPLNNLRVLGYLGENLGADEAARTTWYHHWLRQGFDALERTVGSGSFCFGEAPTLADVLLVPQVYNALRFRLDMASYPRLAAIAAHAGAQPAFRAAHPDAQPDAPAPA